jgi:hypothetical protein
VAEDETCDVDSKVPSSLNTTVSLYTKGRHEAYTSTIMPAKYGCECLKS